MCAVNAYECYKILSDRRNERRAAHERVKIRLKESFSSVNAQKYDDNQRRGRVNMRNIEGFYLWKVIL